MAVTFVSSDRIYSTMDMKTNILTASFMALREKLHRSAIGFLKNDEDARDALQDTFFRLWKSGGVESDSEARNKLFTVLRNICIDRLRKPPTIPVNDSYAESAAVQPDFSEDVERLEALISTGLTDTQRRIYSMVAHDGLEYEDIASALDMSVEAVRVNMCRARKKIRENYNKLNR